MVFSFISLAHHVGKDTGWDLALKKGRSNIISRVNQNINDLNFPAIISHLLLHIDFHKVHHLDEKLPFYKLPKRHKILVNQGILTNTVYSSGSISWFLKI